MNAPTVEQREQVYKVLNPTAKQIYKQTQADLAIKNNAFTKASQNYQNALKRELDKTGVDYRTQFPDITLNKISYKTKQEDKPKNQPTIIPIQEANKNLQKELEAKQKTYDEWKMANYQNNLARVQSEDTTFLDKTLGTPVRAISDLLSPLTIGEDTVIRDEKGNKTYLPSYSELKQQKVRQDTPGIGGVFQDIGYNATKILGAAGIDALTGGIGGKSLYWTDMATDNYKNIINQGYSNKDAILNTIIATGSEFLTEKLMGGLTKKLTGGKASGVQNYISNTINKTIQNPKVANILGSMTSEGLEEFTQEWISALNNNLTLGKNINIEKTIQDSLYSALVGAGSGGLVTGTFNQEGRIADINSKALQDQVNALKTSKNLTANEKTKTKIDESINKAQNYIDKPFGKDASDLIDNTQKDLTKYNKSIIREQKKAQKQAQQAQIEQPSTNTLEEVKQAPISNLNEQEQDELNQLKNFPIDYGIEEDTKLDKLLTKENENIKNQMSPVRNLEEVRDYKEVGNKDINAYQYDNPEVKPYFQQVAKQMLADLSEGTKGQRYTTADGQWKGVKRSIANDIAKILDGEKGVKYSYKQIEDGLNAIINDKGSENKAVAKRLEFYIDQRLRNGFTDAYGEKIKPNQNYINTLREKNISTSNETSQQNIPEVKKEPVITELSTTTQEFKQAQEKVKDGTATEKERKYIKTATEAQNTQKYLKEMDDIAKTYTPIANETSLKNAENQLAPFKSLEERVNYIESVLNSGKRVTSSDVAAAEILLKEAAASKNIELYNKVLADTALLGTEYGQAIQALSMIRKMSPTAQLDVLEKIINREKAKGNKSYENVKVTNEMRNKILDCYDENGKVNQEKFDATMEEIKVDLAKNIKASIGDKIRAWRYLSMLGNPKTHVRNMVANAAMTIVKKTKDLGSGLVQDIFIHNKNKQTATAKFASKEVKNLANEKIKELYTKDSQTSKYNEKSDLENRKQVFKLKAFEGARKINENLLSAEDTISKRINFKSAFTNYLTAHGISTAEDIKNNPQVIREATTFAEQEANVATFNQRNQLAEYINKLDNLGEFGKVARGAIIPFTRTPLNIAKTGIEYTPGTGMITTLSDMKKAPQNMKGAVLIDGLSKQMTGASLALLGYALAKGGLVTAKTDDDKEDKFLKDKGAKADYSIKLGNTSYDLSWLSPSSMPFFVGARMFEVLDKQEGINPNVIMEGLASTLDPLSEMSVIQSFTKILSSYKTDSNQMLKEMGEETAKSYVSQFIPTVLGQFAKLFDDKKRSTYADKNSKFSFGQELWRSVLYKIPGARNTLPEQTDFTGKTKKEYNDLYNVFLSPANKARDTMTKQDKELVRLYRKTGNDDILPYALGSNVKFNDNSYQMSTKEYNKYKKDFGNTYEDNVEDLMQKSAYKNATDDEKTEMISGIMKYSKDKTKDNFLTKKGENYVKTTKKGISPYESDKVDELTNDNFSISDYYIYKTNTPNIVNGNVQNVKNKINLINTFGIDNEIYSKYMEEINNIKGSDRKQKIFNYINGLDLTSEQKQLLMKKVYKTYRSYDDKFYNTINNSNLTKEEKESLKNFLKIGE